MSVTGGGFGIKGRSAVLATIALFAVLLLTSPARANIDVTLDITAATEGPHVDQGGPRALPRTGFDPLPLGGVAMLLIALGSLGLANQKRTDRQGERTS